MKTLRYNDIYEILLGATFMASGGGGPIDISLEMLDNINNVEVDIYTIDEMESNKYVTTIAAMGKPTEARNKDFNKILTNTYEYIKQQVLPKDITIGYCMAGEYGGFNTFAPIYLAIVNKDIKLIDADSSSRAVPGLDTTLTSLNGGSIIPFVMANENNDCICIDLNDKQNASGCEKVCRQICSSELFNSVSGVSGWIMNKEEVNKYAIPNSLNIAKVVGGYVNKYKSISYDGSVFDLLNNNYIIKAKTLAHNRDGNRSIISNVIIERKDGFDLGKIFIEFNEIKWEIHFINESLVLYKNNEPYMTAPDIVCIFDDEKCMPLTNDYIVLNKENIIGTKVSLGIMPVHKLWWNNRTTEQMTNIWKYYFEAVEYNGNCIKYEETI